MKKINSTVTKGVAKVPVIMQLESLECGAASLAMVLAYYGKWLPLEQVRSDCGVSRDGSKAGHIYKAAQNYGFNVEAYKTTPEQLKKEGRFPCIIHWNMNHFVVLDGFRKGKVYLNDPARGNVTVTWEEFDKAFTGVCIIPVPGENFKPEGKPKSTLEFARKRLKGAGAALIFMMITTALAYLFGILNSVTSRVYMDRILPGTNENWVYPFMLLLVAIAVIQIAVELAQTIYTLRVNGKMDAIGSCSYMWKVLRLPMDFFSQRLAGDIKNRLTENASIAQTLIQTFAPLLLNSVMMVFYLVLMLRQSTPLTMIGLATLVVNFIMSRVISMKRVNIARVAMRDTGQLSSATLTGIDMIETIKASGAEAGFFKKWSGYQASVNSADIDTKKTTYYLGIVPTFASMTAKYIVFYIGIYLTMKGNFTLGTVMMFQGFLSSFMDPAMAFVAAGQHIQEMRTQMERVEDVMEYPDDAIFNESDISDDEIIGKLSGNIEINDITFGYSKLEPPLIKNFSLNIKKGERVAIVGASGSGKSTIAKLVSGLYQPQSGSILFDGKASYEYPRDVVTSSVAVVDQDITLFEGTILDNIRMWDESIKDFDVILAARDAKLHDAILLKRGGYRHVLSSGGKELSGGQRQRMEIARALALDPTIIILDEATSALDAKTEHEVVEAISRRGITCIVVAHRLSAVRDCDRIIVLDHGDVVETGTHDELIAKRTAYYELVSSE